MSLPSASGGVARFRAPWKVVVPVRTIACAEGSRVELPVTFTVTGRCATFPKFVCDFVPMMDVAARATAQALRRCTSSYRLMFVLVLDVDEPDASTAFPPCLVDGGCDYFTHPGA